MKKKEFFDISLPKWPALAVVGKPVTQEQAMEILIRTDDLYFSSNDSEFNNDLNEALFDIRISSSDHDSLRKAICRKLDINPEGNVWNEIQEYKKSFLEPIEHLDLEYLRNQRIASCWIGGPHGWCDWDGNIGSRNYNIGKYPSVQEVYNDWKQIAEAFPFLELTCQLMGHEAGPEDGVDQPLVEFRVKAGKVKMVQPKSPITYTAFGSADIASRFLNPRAERGCTIELFRSALEHTKNSVKAQNEERKNNTEVIYEEDTKLS